MPRRPLTSREVAIGSRTWRILEVGAKELPSAYADCSHPPGRHPTIRIRKSLQPKDRLYALIHEALHASRPELDEEAVVSTAHDIARVLWGDGWRRP